jgi:hypothetical protein
MDTDETQPKTFGHDLSRSGSGERNSPKVKVREDGASGRKRVHLQNSPDKTHSDHSDHPVKNPAG